jgi:hypothetical protein
MLHWLIRYCSECPTGLANIMPRQQRPYGRVVPYSKRPTHLNDHHLVGRRDGRQAVRDDDDRAAACEV